MSAMRYSTGQIQPWIAALYRQFQARHRHQHRHRRQALHLAQRQAVVVPAVAVAAAAVAEVVAARQHRHREVLAGHQLQLREWVWVEWAVEEDYNALLQRNKPGHQARFFCGYACLNFQGQRHLSCKSLYFTDSFPVFRKLRLS